MAPSRTEILENIQRISQRLKGLASRSFDLPQSAPPRPTPHVCPDLPLPIEIYTILLSAGAPSMLAQKLSEAFMTRALELRDHCTQVIQRSCQRLASLPNVEGLLPLSQQIERLQHVHLRNYQTQLARLKDEASQFIPPRESTQARPPNGEPSGVDWDDMSDSSDHDDEQCRFTTVSQLTILPIFDADITI
jgi:hypothetical protein